MLWFESLGCGSPRKLIQGLMLLSSLHFYQKQSTNCSSVSKKTKEKRKRYRRAHNRHPTGHTRNRRHGPTDGDIWHIWVRTRFGTVFPDTSSSLHFQPPVAQFSATCQAHLQVPATAAHLVNRHLLQHVRYQLLGSQALRR